MNLKHFSDILGNTTKGKNKIRKVWKKEEIKY